MQILFNGGRCFAPKAADCVPADVDYAPVALPHDWLNGQESHLYESSDGGADEK